MKNRRNPFTVILTLLLICASMVISSCTSNNISQTGPSTSDIEEVVNDYFKITFDFKRGGSASSQYAIWIEDSKGNLVKTIVATSYTVKGGYKTRKDSIPTWVKKADPSKMSTNEIDEISGATPKIGKQIYTWDLKDNKGNIVPIGEYTFYFEGTLYWKSRVMYSGKFMVGKNSINEIEIKKEIFNEQDKNKDMIENVSAKYIVNE